MPANDLNARERKIIQGLGLEDEGGHAMRVLERLFPGIITRLTKGLTAAQAREKRCWSVDRQCMVDKCMAWQWKRKRRHWHHAFHERRGYCSALPK